MKYYVFVCPVLSMTYMYSSMEALIARCKRLTTLSMDGRLANKLLVT